MASARRFGGSRGAIACLSEADLYGFDLDKLDPMAIGRNLGCEVEKLMGTFPNVPGDADA